MIGVKTFVIGREALFCLFGILLCLATFQNCSPARFSSPNGEGPSTARELSSVSGFLEIEGGRSATNKKILAVEIKGVDNQAISHMRFAREEQLIGGEIPKSIPWQTFQAKTEFDLDVEWASDGTKDRAKNLVAEVKKIASPDEKIPLLRASILLDTVPPRVEALGLMKHGLVGARYEKNQRVDLDWNAMDIPAPTGRMSGVDPMEGVQVGWADDADCSKVAANNLGPKLPDSSQARQFIWPKSTKLEAFYICVFVQDLAGNRSTGLSQPMTQIWRIVAGDNNQGNGGSWKAANVRFGAPDLLVMDSKNNLFIYDGDYLTIRRVKPDGTIETFIGNGRLGDFLPEDRLRSPMPGAQSLDMDSADRLYVRTKNYIRRLTQKSPPDGTQVTVETLMTPGDLNIRGSDIKRFPDGKEYMLLTTHRADPKNVLYLDAYVYKVPLKDLETFNLTASKNSLAPYRIAGTGDVLKTSSGLLPAMQSADTAVLPIVGPVTADAKGRIYVSGSKDSVYGYGEYTVFVIENGKIFKLTSDRNPVYFMGLVTLPGKRDFLVLRGSAGALELKWDKLPLSADLAITKLTAGGTVDGLIAVANAANTAQEPVFYAPNLTYSKINKFQGLALLDQFGRDVYNVNDTRALSAIIARPHGVTEDKNGNVYIAEYLSGVIRKVDPAGNLSVFAGTPFKFGHFSQQEGKEPAVANLGGHLLGYDENGDRLIHAGSNNSAILFLPLKAGEKITTLATNPLPSTTMQVSSPLSTIAAANWNKLRDTNNWSVRDLQVRSINGKTEILAYRGIDLPFRAQVIHYGFPFTGPQTGTPVLGSELSSNSIFLAGGASPTTTTGPSMSVSFASLITAFQNLVYYTGVDGKLLVSNGRQVTPVTGASVAGRIAIFEDTQLRRYFIGFFGQTLRVTVLSPDGKVMKNEVLCLPGTFLNPTDLKLSRDGNSLLVSDGGFNRVLRYTIRENGKVFLYRDVSGVCKALEI